MLDFLEYKKDDLDELVSDLFQGICDSIEGGKHLILQPALKAAKAWKNIRSTDDGRQSTMTLHRTLCGVWPWTWQYGRDV